MIAAAVWLATMAAPIAGGMVDTSHTAVGELVGLDGARCTATLIAPQAAITAAHCITGSPQVLSLADGDYAVVASHIAPGFDAATLAGDLAVIELDRASSVAPIAIADSSMVLGESMLIVGFGRDAAGSAGTRRAAVASIASLTGPRFSTEGDASACAGDSGGAVLTAAGTLAGVISSGDAACGGANRHVRLGAFTPWLARVVPATGLLATDVPPTITITSPTNGDSVPDVFALELALADDHGALTVTIAIDGTAKDPQEVTGNAMTLQLAIAPGEHVLTVTATDATGSSASTIELLVEPPTAPADPAGCDAGGRPRGVLVLLAIALVCLRRRC